MFLLIGYTQLNKFSGCLRLSVTVHDYHQGSYAWTEHLVDSPWVRDSSGRWWNEGGMIYARGYGIVRS